MVLIEHPKIAGLVPVWAPFHGFSILFDNPGTSLLRQPNGMQLLHNPPQGTPGQELYTALQSWLQDVGPALLMNTYGFCPLPVESYHVTAWDGLSDQQSSQVDPAFEPAVSSFLQQLPDSLVGRQAFMEEVKSGQLMTKDHWKLRFRFSYLSFWSSTGLAAVLQPADEHSQQLLSHLRQRRQRLSDDFSARLQFLHGSPEYLPHITLGYFLNQRMARRLSPHVEIRHWSQQLREATEDIVLEFSSMGVYAFTDMASYYRIS